MKRKLSLSQRLGAAAAAGSLLGFGSVSAEGLATRTEWPMFRGSPGLSGVSPATLPDTLSLVWSHKTGGPVKSSAAIVGGRVFIGSDDKQLHALDQKTGRPLWTFPTQGEIESSPLVLDGRVYFGSSDGSVYAVEAATGKKIWSYATGDKVLGSPNWVLAPDGKSKWVLAGSYDFSLYSFNAATGATNWTYETGNYINGSPAVADGQTVFGGCDALLHVISLADGKKVKEVEAGAYIAGSGAFEKGRFYVGHYENEVLCMDLGAAQRVWTFKDRAFPYFSSPALTPDRVVFGGRDKKLHSLNKQTGEAIWSFPTRGKVDSSPVVSGQKVVVGSEDGFLYVVNLPDGQLVWSYEVGQAITSSPAVVDGLVVVGSEDGSVYAFGAKSR